MEWPLKNACTGLTLSSPAAQCSCAKMQCESDDMNKNDLRCMPDMTDCVYLQEVLLSHNKFKSVPLGAFYCGSLQLVDVRHNNILEPPT